MGNYTNHCREIRCGCSSRSNRRDDGKIVSQKVLLIALLLDRELKDLVIERGIMENISFPLSVDRQMHSTRA